MSLTIEDKGLALQDPDESRVYTFDFDDRLAAGVTITTATFTITPASTGLTKDNPSTTARTASVRLIGGTMGVSYRINCKIVTDESPSQTIDTWFTLRCEGVDE